MKTSSPFEFVLIEERNGFNVVVDLPRHHILRNQGFSDVLDSHTGSEKHSLAFVSDLSLNVGSHI